MSEPKVIMLKGKYDGLIYSERVNRSQAWPGNNEEEQFQAQRRISEAADTFDWTNVNRQFGSSRATIGKNKANEKVPEGLFINRFQHFS